MVRVRNHRQPGRQPASCDVRSLNIVFDRRRRGGRFRLLDPILDGENALIQYRHIRVLQDGLEREDSKERGKEKK